MRLLWFDCREGFLEKCQCNHISHASHLTMQVCKCSWIKTTYWSEWFLHSQARYDFSTETLANLKFQKKSKIWDLILFTTSIQVVAKQKYQTCSQLRNLHPVDKKTPNQPIRTPTNLIKIFFVCVLLSISLPNQSMSEKKNQSYR